MSVDVIVIGAGLAGLSAAQSLRKAGLVVTVLEAREEVGGRLRSLDAGGGRWMELGAQWISKDHRRMMALAKRYGVRLHPTYRKGRMLSGSHGSASLSSDISALLQAFFFVTGAIATTRKINAAGSAELDLISAADFIRSRRSLTKAGKQHLVRLISSELCHSAEKVSAYELMQQLASMKTALNVAQADAYIFTDGGQKIADGVAEGIADDHGNGLHLSEPVLSVVQSTDHITVTTATKAIEARYAILAIPPQLIAGIGFSPALPRNVSDVLGNFLPGKVVKTLALYEEPFWRKAGLSGTISAPGSAFPLVIDSAPANGGYGLLTCLSTAETADAAAAMPEANRCAAYLEFLQEHIGSQAGNPVRVVSTDWNAQIFSRGGYASRRAPGGWLTAPDLFSPVGRIHFAGTETSGVWRSYMEGAVASGERAAREVLQAARV